MTYIKIYLKKTALTAFSIAILVILCELHNSDLLAENNLEALKIREELNEPGDLNSQQEDEQENNNEDTEEEPEENIKLKKIKNIKIIGKNFEDKTLVSQGALNSKIPFKVGQLYDPLKSGQLIRSLYSLNYFNDIELKTEDVSDEEINLYIILNQKKKIEKIVYNGNDSLKKDEIDKKYKFSDIQAIDQDEANLLVLKLKKLYAEKNYHNTDITVRLEDTTSGNVDLIFDIKEGTRAAVKRVNFVGNKCFSGKRLRSMIFTREDWFLSFVDKSGTYQPEALEYDKHVLENFYQSNGFLAARVTNIDVNIDKESQCIDITFYIEEGDTYTINTISAPENELQTEEQILKTIKIKPGQLYSKDEIRKNLEILRNVYGRFGYIDADIEPAIKPNVDEKTVDLTFYTDLGSKVFLNRINIIGNKKTRDNVIRRNIILNEGELLTTQGMDISKKRVESLGYFDPQNGVNWKINKISKDTADLDLLLNEIKTGKFYAQLGYGGADIKSPSTSLKLSAGVSDRNLLGRGLRYNLNLTWSKEDRGAFFSIMQPSLFDRPIGIGLNAYHRRSLYDDMKNVRNIPVETVTGGDTVLNFAPQFLPDVITFFNLGLERIAYKNPVEVAPEGKSPEQVTQFQAILNRRFQPGTLTWVGFNTGQDLRNHPVFPSRGYNWNFISKIGLPTFDKNFGYYKFDLDTTFLTPLIGDYDLIFLLHAHFGIAKPFANKSVPYRELYHIGGPATVRGFNFGQIGPQIFGDSVGAQKAFWVNAELIFSVTKDQSIRGILFYDGGAGWDTPNANALGDVRVVNNDFRFRHAIGFGIRLTQPTPLRVDWGFKLDRNKRLGESISEVHFSMSQDF